MEPIHVSETLAGNPAAPKAEEVAATPEKPLEEDQQAMMAFEHFTGKLIQKLNTFRGSKKQVIRAWANSSISPLNKEDLHFSYSEEKELFDLFTEANSAKLILMVHGFQKAGVVQILKPLIQANELTDSEKQLMEMNKTSEGEKVNE